MPEMRFTEFPALSIDPRVGISRSASETDDWLFFLPIIEKTIEALKRMFTIYVVWRPSPNVIRPFSLRRVKNVCKQLTSFLVSRVSCLSPWARQKFSALLKIERTLSHRWQKNLLPKLFRFFVCVFFFLRLSVPFLRKGVVCECSLSWAS